MGTIALSLPVIGQPDTTEDVKIVNDFTTLQTLLNGNVDTTNLSPTAAIADTQLASPNNGTYRLMKTTPWVFCTSGNLVGGPFLITDLPGTPPGSLQAVSNPMTVMSSALSYSVPIFTTTSVFSVAGKTTFYVLSVEAMINNTAIGSNGVRGVLFSVSPTGGSSTTVQATVTQTQSTGALIASGASDALISASSGAFALSANTAYAFGLINGGGFSANSAAMMRCLLYQYFA